MTTAGYDDFKVPVLGDNPTPEERAEYVILRLEQFIRDGRTLDEGMSFKKWQAMAKTEITIAISEAENSQKHDEINSRRVLFVAAAAMVTIGFWGTAVSYHNVGNMAAGIVCTVAGLVLVFAAGGWRARKWNNSRQAKERRRRLARIENLNKRIKRLEGMLEKEEKELVEALDKLLEKKRKPRSAVG
ncbi:MAG: hypothetical protein VW338_11825 [Rhodospirillaceae bacterium]|jgi:flagellar motility protein MotE (MotC chaperone)